MKPTFLLVTLLAACLHIKAQKNYSGVYGYERKPPAETGNDEKATGPNGKLVLLKMDGNKYRFWLDVAGGWPSYQTGETDGTITIVNDTASFDNTHVDAMSNCVLHFLFTGTTVRISGNAAAYNCGFGEGISADAEYPRLKIQPELNNDWLRKEYYDAPTIVVTTAKTELFQDESLLHPFSPKQFVNKGEKYLGVGETKDAFYTEYITPQGKFIYGWMRKTNVTRTNTN